MLLSPPPQASPRSPCCEVQNCCAERAATSAMLDEHSPSVLQSFPWSSVQAMVPVAVHYLQLFTKPPPCPSLITLSYHLKLFIFIPTCHLKLLKCSTNSLQGSLLSSHFPARCPKSSQGTLVPGMHLPVGGMASSQLSLRLRHSQQLQHLKAASPPLQITSIHCYWCIGSP